MTALPQQLRFRHNVSCILLFWCMLGLAAVVPSQARAQNPPALTICKQTIPPGSGTAFNFTGANSWTPPTVPPGRDFTSLYPPNPFPLQDGGCKVLPLTAGHDVYNEITESPVPGWALTNIFCNNVKSVVSIVGGNSNQAFQFGDNKVTIDQTEPNVTCTFVNTACFKYGSDSLPPCTRPGEITSLDLSTVDKAIGGVDPNWTVGPGGPNPTSASLSPSWTAVANNWVVPNGTDATYTYTRWFNLPCRPGSYQRLQLSGTFAADNGGNVLLNGNPLVSCPSSSTNPGTCFQTPAAGTSFTDNNPLHFNQGINQLTVIVGNQTGSVTGVSVKAQVSAICGAGCTCGCPPGSVMGRNGKCGPQTATLQVTKAVAPDPGIGSSTSYPVQVMCTPTGGGPVTLQGSSSTTMNLGVGDICTVQEPPPVVPAGCSGVTVEYAPPQPMTLVAGLNIVTVTNRYTCGTGNGSCPAGAMRQGPNCVGACRSPFVANAARTVCGCPAGLVQRGQSCARPAGPSKRKI